MLATNKRPVLVAGGAGFIGSNLVSWLLERGREVHCIDNYVTGTRSANARHLANRKFRLFDADITDEQFVSNLSHFDYGEVYNLACPTGVPNNRRLGEVMLLTSSEGSLNLLRLARATGAKYLFTSTAEAYGDPLVFPQHESYTGNVDPVGPRSPYEEGKRFAEALTAFYARQHGVDARTVRVFNTYGVNMALTDTRVIPSMLLSMALGKPAVIYGDGNNTRSFLYVTDLLDGFALVMADRHSGEVFNIGGEQEMTVNALFEVCKQVTGSTARADYQPHFIDDHRRRLPDTGKVRALGWKPNVTLEQGLALSFGDMKERIANGEFSEDEGVLGDNIAARAAEVQPAWLA